MSLAKRYLVNLINNKFQQISFIRTFWKSKINWTLIFTSVKASQGQQIIDSSSISSGYWTLYIFPSLTFSLSPSSKHSYSFCVPVSVCLTLPKHPFWNKIVKHFFANLFRLFLPVPSLSLSRSMLNQIKTMQINVNMRHLTLEVKQLQATSAATTAAQQHQMRLCCTCNTQQKR